MSMEHAQFPHRVNHDGTYDSICRMCYRTIAHEVREADLADFEASHVCSELDLVVRNKPGENTTEKRNPRTVIANCFSGEKQR